jgi:hypothetical protein
VPIGEQDVARFDVAVHDIVLVGVIERFGDLAGDADRLLDRELLFTLDALAEGLALDVRHHGVEQAVGVSAVVQWQDTGMLQAGFDADFAEKAVCAEGGGYLRAQHLDRDTAAVLPIVRAIDARHAPATDLSIQVVPPG